jgi:uncharacterized protein (UPF0261 family)
MKNEAPSVYVIGTLDTKGDEVAFVADAVRARGVPVAVVDVGTLAPPNREADISREQVAAHHPDGAAAVFEHGDRGKAVSAMSKALRAFLVEEQQSGRCSGVVGLGGSGGTALIASAMRALPIGFPKLMVSTVASGDTSSYIGTSDITMMFSVVDVAGLNRVSRQVYRNAAAAIAGMAQGKASAHDDPPAVGMTMFGLTTKCVTMVRTHVEAAGFDCLVFHATGVGGRAMEELAGSDLLSAVVDLTTTEVADEIVGGVFAAGPHRFDAILRARLPYIMSLGAMDMVNFGPLDSVPERFRGRKLHVHNPSVTLMRTTVEENIACARWIAVKLNAFPDSPFVLLIPEGGVSDLDKPGAPFHDPEADRALFSELERIVVRSSERRIVRIPHHINDRQFADAVNLEFDALALTKHIAGERAGVEPR